MTSPPRHVLYRTFLHHLQRIPDRHIWSTNLPKFRALLESQPPSASPVGAESIPPAESSRSASLRASRAARDLQRARKELRQLQAAVSAQPQALVRLLHKAYGMRGSVRWELIRVRQPRVPSLKSHAVMSNSERQSIQASSPVQDGVLAHRPDLPPCLEPFRPPLLKPNQVPTQRLDKRVKPTAVRKAAKREWERVWAKVKVPLTLPSWGDEHEPGPRTGWEGKGVIEELRRLADLPPLAAGLSPGGEQPNIALPAHIELLIPSPRTPRRDLPTYSTPPPSHTRQNPNSWTFPRTLDARLLRNTYRRVWRLLVWARPIPGAEGKWETCTYQDLISSSSSNASEEAVADGGRVKQRGKTRGTKVEPGLFSSASPEDLRWI